MGNGAERGRTLSSDSTAAAGQDVSGAERGAGQRAVRTLAFAAGLVNGEAGLVLGGHGERRGSVQLHKARNGDCGQGGGGKARSGGG